MDRLELRTKFASKVEKYELAKYNITLNLRGLSALARAELGDKFTALSKAEADSPAITGVREIQARVVSQGLVDDSGNRIYQDNELDDIAKEFPADALDEVAKEIMRISGLGADRVEELKKKSESSPNSGGSDESPAPSSVQMSGNSLPN
jgi:hypothetical protein